MLVGDDKILFIKKIKIDQTLVSFRKVNFNLSMLESQLLSTNHGVNPKGKNFEEFENPRTGF
jgi:hypothetical protein